MHVAIVPRDHQNLLVQLRRLRQRVKAAVAHPARYQVVAGALGRAAAQNGRFDVHEVVCFEVVAHALRHAVAEQHGALHYRTTQVEVTVLESKVFAGQFPHALRGRDGGRHRFIQQLELSDTDLNIARVVLGVGHAGGAWRHVARDLNDVLGPQRLALFDQLGRRIGRIEHHLSNAVTIAKVDKQSTAVIAIAIDPATQGDLLASVGGAKFAASMGSQHGWVPFGFGLDHRIGGNRWNACDQGFRSVDRSCESA